MPAFRRPLGQLVGVRVKAPDAQLSVCGRFYARHRLRRSVEIMVEQMVDAGGLLDK